MAASSRMAIAAWVATLASSAALLPLILGTGWLFTTALLLAVQTGAGMAARRLGFGGPAVVLCQLAVTLPALTAVTVPDHALLGIFPGPEALERLGTLFATGGGDIGHYTAPAPLTEGIRLILLTGVLLIGLLVDLLAVTLRSAAAAGLPLLALYSVASGVARDGGDIGHFLVAAAGFLVLLLTESRDRVSRWGRFFGTRGTGTGETGRPPRPGAGRRIGAMTLGAAVALPLLLPAPGPGLLDPARAAGGGTGGREDFGSVNPVVALQDQLNRPRNRTVLRYETTSGRNADMYLRLVALDAFDGDRWTSSVEPDPEVPPAPWPVEGLAPGVRAEPVSTRITTEPGYSQSSLPVPVPPTRVDAEGYWAHDPQSATLVSARRGQTSANMTYGVEHWDLSPTSEQLSAAPPTADEELWRRYTALPDNLPDVVRETAATVTADATNDYERALALQNWFTRDGGFRYNTRVDSGTGSEAIAAFLEAREGFCVHFAFTMAAMSRSLDIPSRVAVGFTPGTRGADGSHSVGLHNAHAWPELYFEGVGWTRFEPTPGQGSAPEYTRPERETGADRSDADREAPDRAEPGEDPTRTEEDAGDPAECDPTADPGACQDPTAVDPGARGAGESPAGGV
ncbi:transglutaminaseTgpA domain-containing protein, partial [Streptomyces alkaliphilus]|uniref:transglutaminase family protein n=1 Tax=Streptomyces alkaliphilus TaxID=1472722 RepID=UPI00117FBB91